MTRASGARPPGMGFWLHYFPSYLAGLSRVRIIIIVYRAVKFNKENIRKIFGLMSVTCYMLAVFIRYHSIKSILSKAG